MKVFSSGDRKHRRSTTKNTLLPQKLNEYHLAEAGFDGASFSGAVFNLSTTIVGAGIMALPAAVNQLGLIPGLVMIIFSAILTESSIDLILRFGRASKSATYSGVVADALGGPSRTLLQVCIVINNLGMLVVYMIIIGDVLAGTLSDGVRHTGVINEWFGQSWLTTRFALLLLTTLLVFAPLISFKRLGYGEGKMYAVMPAFSMEMRYTSALSVALAVVFVAITAGIAIVKVIEGSIGMPRLMPKITDQASFWKLFTTVPIIVTAYICHHNVHPIENELKDSSQMKSIVRTSLGLCSSVYVATSFFGVLLFGDQTLDDVLANFDGDLGIPYSAVLSALVRVSYGVHLMLVFPIVFFSLRLNLDGLLFPYALPIANDCRRFSLITAALMGLIFAGAIFVPNIWDAFQFTGATAAVSVGFIFPAAIALRDTHGIARKNDRLSSWTMILLAVSSSTVAICSDVYGIFREVQS